MMTLLAAVENWPFSVWLRESPSLFAFPFVLFLHTLGLAMLAGISVALDFWIVAARSWPQRAALAGLYRFMWLGFGINAASGVALLLAYPAKALTNWLFFVKLALILGAVLILDRMRILAVPNGEATGRARTLAVTSLVLWAGIILAGRLLAYTYTILLTSEG